MYYDNANGIVDLSEVAVFNNARTEVTINLKDGGLGDSDHTENGVIVSNIGLADRPQTSGPGGGKGPSCFISFSLAD